MPAVKERINEMARIMCGHQNNKCPMHHDADCSHIGPVDCLYKQYATALFRAGYVHISDNEDIIAQAKKQAKIDVLNTARERCDLVAEELEDEIDHYGSSAAYSCAYGIKKLIKEIENEN